jgi:DNA primase
MTPLRLAIGLLVQNPELAESCRALPQDWRRLVIPGIDLLAQILDLLWIEPNLTTAALIERWRENTHFSALNRLAVYPLQVPAGGEEVELRGAIARLTEQQQESELEQLLAKAQSARISGPDKQRLIELLAARSERRGNGDSA